MTLMDFIKAHDVEFTENLITMEQVKSIEEAIGVPFGRELVEYLISYGYLAYKYVELYGVNSKQLLDSDMVKQSAYLHNYFPKTRGYVAIENQGDGDYFVVGSDDKVYEYISEENKLSDVNLSLFEYILRRFESVAL